MKRRWVLWGLVPATLLLMVVGLGFRLGWWMVFADVNKGAWPWIEAASWLAAILGTVGGGRFVARSKQATATPVTAVKAAERDPCLLNRDNEYGRLHELLSGEQPPGVVQVTGSAGVGKSMLVDTVLKDLRSQGIKFAVHRHVVMAGTRFDVRTLIGDIEDRARPAELNPGETRLTRLRIALRSTGLTRMVIVIEGAEHLAVPGDSRQVDLQVDEALDAVYRHTDPHRVAVILVCRDTLESPAGRLWAREPPISIGRLPGPEFKAFLTRRDSHVLGKLPESRRELLYKRLDGNPRSVQLMLATVELSERGFGMDDMLDTIAGLEPEDVPRRLAEMLTENLNGLHRDVIQALAAFRTPIDAPALAAVIEQPVTVSQVTASLETFVKHELVYLAGDKYALTLPDPAWFLPRNRSSLLRRVAEELKQRRSTDPRSLNDLQSHFAYTAVLLAAGRYPVAFSAMEPMTEVLKRWSCGHLLLTQRRELQGRLGDAGLEMLNDNELGDAYATRGDCPEANAAYGRALDTANRLGNAEISATVRYNFGTYYWQFGRGDLAYGYYEQARQEAEQHHLPEVLMAALQGLAECHRRWGEYDLAFARADRVLADNEPVDLLLRVARWRVETGDTDVARRLIERARAASRASEWYSAACYEARADLLLAESEFPSAAATAADALEQAVQARNPVAVLQARTTLCWTALYTGNLVEARQHIAEAERYRRPGSALVVVALHALVHQKSDPRKAARLFDQLADEARERIKDERDRGAHDMLGFAICGQTLDPDSAIGYFDTSESAASVLRARRNLLLKRLDEYSVPAGRLKPLLSALADSPSRTSD